MVASGEVGESELAATFSVELAAVAAVEASVELSEEFVTGMVVGSEVVETVPLFSAAPGELSGTAVLVAGAAFSGTAAPCMGFILLQKHLLS